MKDWADIVINNRDAFMGGIGMTAGLLVLSCIIGGVLAVPLALIRVTKPGILGGVVAVYSLIFRGTPLLAQLFLIYYGLAQLDWIRHSVLWPVLREAWPCALIALSLNFSAYLAEALRGGILGIPAGEREAAMAMGMRPLLLMRRIILPRGFGIALPALGNEVILQLKSTALVGTITLLDLTGVARRVATRTYAIDALFIAGVVYVILSYAIGRIFRLLEHRTNRHLAV